MFTTTGVGGTNCLSDALGRTPFDAGVRALVPPPPPPPGLKCEGGSVTEDGSEKVIGSMKNGAVDENLRFGVLAKRNSEQHDDDTNMRQNRKKFGNAILPLLPQLLHGNRRRGRFDVMRMEFVVNDGFDLRQQRGNLIRSIHEPVQSGWIRYGRDFRARRRIPAFGEVLTDLPDQRNEPGIWIGETRSSQEDGVLFGFGMVGFHFWTPPTTPPAFS